MTRRRSTTAAGSAREDALVPVSRRDEGGAVVPVSRREENLGARTACIWKKSSIRRTAVSLRSVTSRSSPDALDDATVLSPMPYRTPGLVLRPGAVTAGSSFELLQPIESPRLV